MNDQQVIDAVRVINAEIYDVTRSHWIMMEARSDGLTNMVMFLGRRIWDDDDDDRPYADNGVDHIPLTDHLRQEMREQIRELLPLLPCPADGAPRIVCAAVRTAHYSKDMRTVLRAMYGDEYQSIVQEQGFLDARGEFLTRTEAWTRAKATGQIIRDVGTEGELHSENLY